jgi:methylamine---glutamate N-methyltransferase subunit A
MCGIAGVFLKDRKLASDLGAMLAGMLSALGDRGPDSAGFAVYGEEAVGQVKFTVRAPDRYDFDPLLKRVRELAGGRVALRTHGTHAVLSVPAERSALVRSALAAFGEVTLVGSGRRMEIFKEVGRPEEVARRFDLTTMIGTHAIGHTRMATESAVTTNGAHPFTTGDDQCLVHNGSLSNHNAVRRDLVRQGFSFRTENDTEVAAGFVSSRLRTGCTLQQAMEACVTSLDGFYTFVVGTETGFGVLRDPVACKPAVVAETDRLVAFGTEYRALVDLPGIGTAKVWEPAPARVYQWNLH